MSFTKITEGDLANKGVTGLADTPNLSTMEMQQKFDELAKDVIVPKFNELSEELDEKGLEKSTISDDITNFRLDDDGRLQVSTDGGETYGYAGSTGHAIMDGSGTTYPARARMQFSANVQITDDAVNNKTFLSVAGQKGDKGDSATITVGTVEEGDIASVENVGSSQDAIFNFTLPKGDDGDAATIQVGSVYSGDNPSVTNRGTSSNAIFDFILPKGDQGDPGTGLTLLDTYATYEELIAAHPTGQRGQAYLVGDETESTVYLWSTTNNEWTNVGSLKGAKGDTGSAGTITVGTVTESDTMTVENVGTSEHAVFNFGLKKGEKGDTGGTGTISVGTVTTSDYPTVTNVGTPTAAIFNFGIPRGEQGPQGNPTEVNGKSGALITLFGSDIYEDDSEEAKTVNERIAEAEQAVEDMGDEVDSLSAVVGSASDLPTPTDTVAENIAAINTNLVAHSTFPNDNGFYPDYQNGTFGFNTDIERGADTFHPFNNGGAIGQFNASTSTTTHISLGFKPKVIIVHRNSNSGVINVYDEDYSTTVERRRGGTSANFTEMNIGGTDNSHFYSIDDDGFTWAKRGSDDYALFYVAY